MKEWLTREIYAKLAFPLFRRIIPVNPLVIYYHIVSDTYVPHVSDLYSFRTTIEFERDINTLLRFFRPLSLHDFLASVESKHPVAPKSFMITFDDGLSECHSNITPILNAHGIPATFFLCSAFLDNKELAYDHKKSLLCDLLRNRKLTSVEESQTRELLGSAGIFESSLAAALLRVDYRRKQLLDSIAAVLKYDFSAYLNSTKPYLTSDQVRGLLKMGHSIGAHSVDHPRYSDLPLAEQIYQTRTSVRFVKDQFNLGYGAFSFPHSDTSVSGEFFDEIFATRDVDVCFGNQGFVEDQEPRNIQRSSMEKSARPAEGILGRGLARRFVKAITGRLVVNRA